MSICCLSVLHWSPSPKRIHFKPVKPILISQFYDKTLLTTWARYELTTWSFRRSTQQDDDVCGGDKIFKAPNVHTIISSRWHLFWTHTMQYFSKVFTSTDARCQINRRGCDSSIKPRTRLIRLLHWPIIIQSTWTKRTQVSCFRSLTVRFVSDTRG